MRVGIMELAIHDLPLMRRLLPSDAVPRVTSARLLRPFGYALNIEAAGVIVDLMGLMHGHWQPDWKLEAVSGDSSLELDFTPSFVHAGSGTARWHDAGRSEGNSPAADNGYVREWRELARILSGDAEAPDPVEAVRDYRFACAIAEQANALLVAGELQ
jgi:predicted dehydrogenase